MCTTFRSGLVSSGALHSVLVMAKCLLALHAREGACYRSALYVCMRVVYAMAWLLRLLWGWNSRCPPAVRVHAPVSAAGGPLCFPGVVVAVRHRPPFTPGPGGRSRRGAWRRDATAVEPFVVDGRGIGMSLRMPAVMRPSAGGAVQQEGRMGHGH